MKVTLEIPDNSRAMVVTTVFLSDPCTLHMNTTEILASQLKDGAIIDAMPEEINNKKEEKNE